MEVIFKVEDISNFCDIELDYKKQEQKGYIIHNWRGLDIALYCTPIALTNSILYKNQDKLIKIYDSNYLATCVVSPFEILKSPFITHRKPAILNLRNTPSEELADYLLTEQKETLGKRILEEVNRTNEVPDKRFNGWLYWVDN